jgi:hypothetical protein
MRPAAVGLLLLGALAECSDRDGLSQARTGVKGEFYLGGEARIPGLPEFMTATLDGAAGPNGYRQLLVGLRFHFGAAANQPMRHRHVGDTPAFPGFDVGGFARARNSPPCVPDPSITLGFNGCATLL